MDPNIYYYGIFVVLYIVMEISLYLSSRNENKKNLFILFLYYIITSVSLVILMTDTQITTTLYTIVALITTVVMLTFINRTFYQGRKSPFKIILISAIILRLTELIIALVYEGIVTVDNEIYDRLHLIRVISIGCGIILTAVWMFMSAMNSLKSLSSSKAVEPWVIGRYKLIEFYNICDIVMGILIWFSPPPSSSQINITLLLILVLNMLKISTELLAWVMPKRFKNYLNRGYTSTAIIEELSEEEIMEGMR